MPKVGSFIGGKKKNIFKSNRWGGRTLKSVSAVINRDGKGGWGRLDYFKFMAGISAAQ